MEVILLDIEGTTTPISFVHETLFPYVLSTLDEFLKAHWTDQELQFHIQALEEQARQDQPHYDAPQIISSDPDSTRKSLIDNIQWQMKLDRKTSALKGLQGYMWRFGYQSGQLQGVMFDDAVQAIKNWTQEGKRVYIYSSGSVEAQKLIFGYSDHGNLLQYISGHYDTKVGAKTSSDSYRKIAEDIKTKPENTLFISDNIREIEAANQAGMQVVVSVRPGNAPLPSHNFAESSDFTTIH
ncbi:enolase-phosphatase E1 [Coemansia brasiliensis]|uniref:Enolase-phosphatase E1 n=1 Tax=Coemansia brasiliensis TaxID=2650707 RepID=A0A9W8IDZ0_9FUNG|nr:enolase-phosphatase E1 [Coemansia brasiliensis]